MKNSNAGLKNQKPQRNKILRFNFPHPSRRVRLNKAPASQDEEKLYIKPHAEEAAYLKISGRLEA